MNHKILFQIIFLSIVILLLGMQVKGHPQNKKINTNISAKTDTSETKHKNQIMDLIREGLRHRYENPDSALFFYEKALVLAREKKLPDMKANALSAIGGIHYIRGEYDFAMEGYMEALSIWESTGNKKGISIGLNNVGLIKNMQEHYEDAINNHKLSMEISKKINDSAMTAINLLNIGISYLAMNKPDTALYYLQKSERIKNSLDEKQGVNQVRNIIGEAYLAKKDYNKAIATYQEIIAKKEETNNWEISYAYAGLAKAYQKRGANAKSIFYAEEALKIAKDLNAKWDLQNITKILADNYAATGQWEKAYEYLAKHKAYSDSVFNERRENQINYLRLKRQDLKNKALGKENKIKEFTLTRQRHQMIASVIAGVILLLIAFLLYRNNSLKSKLNKDLQKKNEEIAAKNKQLSELNITKDLLFRVMAHDLKNPLSLVISYTELMEEDFDSFESEELLDFIRKLNHASNDGLLLLENLMDWARSQTGVIKVHPEKFELNAIIEESLRLVSHNASAKDISIEIRIDDSTLVWADKNMTSAIFRNLLTNAVKFTREGGEITLSDRKKKGVVEVKVTDNGVGIKKENLNKLFDLKYKYSEEGTNKEKGTGLGLIICKDFSKKQGGDIHVESKKGEGTTFTVDIPSA